MEQHVILPGQASELDELEMAIANLRDCQTELKKEAYDPKRAQFIKEWLIDLYTIRNHHPEYTPEPKKRMAYKMKSDDEILLSDPDLMNIAARTEFIDPFDNNKEWQESAMVQELLDGLTIMEHEAVSMVWLHGLGPTEAAYYMSCSARNVSTYLIRARTKMIAKLQNSSQMVLSGFDIPPTVRRHRSKNLSKPRPNQTETVQERSQLTLF
ncbi:RNA polymerase sigma factor [Desulfosporosinus shakirovi]|uniref:hypothetical protein n=1 Tax=Desulfosporosinus shakirovi TaxID=2885154 RepID=UPI001E5382AA|nr:hypothetical protein [Desulfosporosinus sp. SRJS8]MCB8818659.1 hypothetical protein [Desulfosporosinus sp. SRJS8]